MDLELNWSKGKDDTGLKSPLLPPINVSLLALLLLGKPIKPLQGIAFQSFVFFYLYFITFHHVNSSKLPQVLPAFFNKIGFFVG